MVQPLKQFQLDYTHRMHICLVTSKLPPTRCGVGDYTVQLASHLIKKGNQITIITGIDQSNYHFPIEIRNVLPNWKAKGVIKLIKEIQFINPDVIILQWVPFLYSRLGINIWIPLLAFWLKIKKFPIQIMIHEMWVPMVNWKWCVTGPLQRLILIWLITSSSKIYVSIDPWAKKIKRYVPWKSKNIFWIPVGSNIAPLFTNQVNLTKKNTKLDLNIPFTATVVAIFSPLGSEKDNTFLDQVWSIISINKPNIYLLVIGVTKQEMSTAFPSILNYSNVRYSGYISTNDVSKWLTCADIFLAPFIDGISSRRTSTIAAIAHGLPIITTRGNRFDPEFFEKSPLIITNYNLNDFTKAVLELIERPIQIKTIGRATKKFFHKNFDWNVITKQFLKHNKDLQ